MFEAIASTVYGVNGVNSKLRVELLNNFEGERVSPFMAIKRLLGIDEALNHYESVRAARAELSEFDYVFVFVTAAGFDQRWWEEIRGLADLLEKGQPAVCLCAIALDPWCAIDSVPRFDFLRALPAPDVLSMSDASDSALWRRYVHHRIAWEAGGDITLARAFDLQLHGIAVGSEQVLEQGFNEIAATYFKESGMGDQLQAFLEGIDNPRGVTQTPDVDARRTELMRCGLIWCPPFSGGNEVTPWASRALLRTATATASKARLRANLVCVPIAGEIFSFCARAEAVTRQHLSRKTKRELPPPAAGESLDKLVRGKDDYLDYPLGHPAPPSRLEDIWTFAPFGDFLGAHHSVDVLSNHRKLLGLRNAVAHGHYVTWRHVQLAAGIRAALSI